MCVCVCVCLYFFPNCFWCSQTGDHQQQDLPKSAIDQIWKVYIKKRIRILFYFGYLLEMIIEIWQLIIIISWSLENLGQFFTKKSSISVQNHVFQFKKMHKFDEIFSKMIEGQNFLFGCMHDYYYYYYCSNHHVNPISMRRRIKVPCIIKRRLS